MLDERIWYWEIVTYTYKSTATEEHIYYDKIAFIF